MKTMILLHETVSTGEVATKNGLSPEIVMGIIEEYQEEFVKSILMNGYALLTESIRIEIVPIKPRKYVLRGREYKSNRVYKLKASMGDPIYSKISAKFDQFREDLGDING